jgi:hypothetical protein
MAELACGYKWGKFRKDLSMRELNRKHRAAAGKTLAAAALLAFGALGLGLAAPAAAGVVVKSSGPSSATYPVGKKLDDSAQITLQSGDSVTILTSRGSRIIRGPGSHRVGARGASKRSAFAILTRQRANSRVRTGAVRGGPSSEASLANPNIWNVDVTQGGRICLANDASVNLWRPDSSGAQNYRVTRLDNERSAMITFADGASQASLSTDVLPVEQGAAYSITSGDETRTLEFVILEDVPRTPEDMASVLAENGCNAQLDLLASRLMVST